MAVNSDARFNGLTERRVCGRTRTSPAMAYTKGFQSPGLNVITLLLFEMDLENPQDLPEDIMEFDEEDLTN